MEDFYKLFLEAINDEEIKELFFNDEYGYANPSNYQIESVQDNINFFNGIPNEFKKQEAEMLVHYLRMYNVPELDNAHQIKVGSKKDIRTINRFKDLLQRTQEEKIFMAIDKSKQDKLKNTINELQTLIRTLEDALIINGEISYLQPLKKSKAPLREHIKSLADKYSLPKRIGKKFIDNLDN